MSSSWLRRRGRGRDDPERQAEINIRRTSEANPDPSKWIRGSEFVLKGPRR